MVLRSGGRIIRSPDNRFGNSDSVCLCDAMSACRCSGNCYPSPGRLNTPESRACTGFSRYAAEFVKDFPSGPNHGPRLTSDCGHCRFRPFPEPSAFIRNARTSSTRGAAPYSISSMRAMRFSRIEMYAASASWSAWRPSSNPGFGVEPVRMLSRNPSISAMNASW